MNILSLIFLGFLVLLFLATFIFLCLWCISLLNFKNKVPFVGTPKKVFLDILQYLDLKNDSVVYDLGGGDSSMLLYFAKLKPKARYVSIENSLFPIILSKMNLFFNKNKNVVLIKKDFFKVDLSKATHITTYLYPNVMDDLLPKFDKELKSGTRLISVSFKFTQKKPILEIDLKENKTILAKKLYVYEF